MGGDPRTKFTGRADDYARARPSYPPAAIDCLLRGLPGVCAHPGRITGDGLEVADIGAGTGISARLLADRGCVVTALEPNAEMIAHADAHPGVTFVAGRAERSGLRSASFSLALCAQAFHWFDHAAALDEFARLLRRPGRVALMWNVRDLDAGFMRAYEALIDEHAVAPVVSPWATGLDAGAVLRERFGEAGHASFAHSDRLTGEASLVRARSASYVPNGGAEGERFAGAFASVVRSFEDGDGLVAWSYRTEVFIADVI